ncbi:MAG: SMP-30/gluconolactonase/LRE family protein [Verrucomicrobiota bacterium]
MKTTRRLSITSLLHYSVLLLAASALAQDAKPIPGIGPVGEIRKVHTGFVFTEGPAADATGALYFTDVRTNRIYKAGLDGKLSTFLENSEGCNGLMFAASGKLIACQGRANRVIAIDIKTKAIEPVAASYNGKPFNAPNDLVLDSRGGVYFTDPAFGQQANNQDKMAVYYADAQGKVTRLIDDLPRPNGTILSPDEKMLYVLPSGTPDVMAYPVESPGKLGKGRVLCKLEQPATGQPRGGDGLSVDTKGNLYLTQPALSAIQVVSPDGKTLGLIRIPEGPANCSFGGKDMKTLYVTARTSLYAARMETTGHRFPARGR